MYHVFFIHSPMGFFFVLAAVNIAAVNIGVRVSFRIMAFSGCMPRSGIARSYGSSVFSFLRNFHTVLHSDCTNLHSYQQCRRVLFSPPLLQCLLFKTFWWWPFRSCVGWYFIVVLICVSLIIGAVEHLFMCFLAICMSSLKKCLFRSSVLFFLLGCGFFVFVFLYWAAWAICIFWRLIPRWCLCKCLLFCGLSFRFCWRFPLLCRRF